MPDIEKVFAKNNEDVEHFGPGDTLNLTEEDKKLIREAEDFVGSMYWFLIKHEEHKMAAYAEALALKLAILRGYEGD